MLTLIVNNAEYRLQYAILRDGEAIHFFECDSRKLSAEFLPRQLSEDCSGLGLRPGEFSRIAAVNGPGNFMGLRITSSFCAALARCCNAFQAGLDYMECLAHNCEAPHRAIHVLTKATRSSVHYAMFRCDRHGTLSRIEQTRLISSPGDIRMLSAEDVFIGSGCEQLGFTGSKPENPTPASLQRACENALWERSDIVPVYIKLCDALQNFDAISEKQGFDLAQSRCFLDETMQSKVIVRQ